MTATSSDDSGLGAARPAGGPGRSAARLQPVVDLADGTVVAYEAPVRRLDGHAADRPGGADLALVERDLLEVCEVTGDALGQAPGDLFDHVDEARRRGLRIALRGLGTSCTALALMPLLHPELLTLDLSPAPPGDCTAAEAVNAATSESAATGALLVADRLRTREQSLLAQSLGIAHGRVDLPHQQTARCVGLELPLLQRPTGASSPFEQHAGVGVRTAPKRLLLTLSRWLEGQGAAAGPAAVVVTSLGVAHWLTPSTVQRYAELGATAALVGVLGVGVPAQPAPGVRGAALPPDDPLRDEWVVAVVGPQFAGALVARDRHERPAGGGDLERLFDYAVTYDREQVLRLAEPLLRRLPAAAPPPAAAAGPNGGDDLGLVVTAALAGSSSGVSVCDAAGPDLPVVWVNPALERLTGLPAAALLGCDARALLAGVDAEQATEQDADLAAGLLAGREVRATVRQSRPDGTSWWNEATALPVRDGRGTVTHWVCTATDVTTRVEAEQQVDHLAHHDPLTGLANRRHLAQHLRAEIGRAGRQGRSVGLLYLDLDGFKSVNDGYGHGVGDLLLVAVAQRLREHVRIGDLLVRQGGDEFLLVLSGLPATHADARRAAREAAGKLRAEVRRPFVLDGHATPFRTSTSIGISLWPHDAADAAEMVELADRSLYRVKARSQDERD